MLLTSWPKDQIQSYSNKYILIFESPIHSRFWERSRFPLGPFGNEPSGVASEYKTESFGENQQAELHSHRCDRPGQSENCSDLRGLDLCWRHVSGWHTLLRLEPSRTGHKCVDVEVAAVSTIPSWQQFAPHFTLVLVLYCFSFFWSSV